MPSLSSGGPTLKPGASVGTRKALIPRLRWVGSVEAKTIARSATGALVMKFLVPFRIQPSPTLAPARVARVRRALASEPASGSESAKQPILRPAARSGR